MAEDNLNILPLAGDTYAGWLYSSLEKFPGQAMHTPPRMSAAKEVERTRRQVVQIGRQVERGSAHIRRGIHKKADMVVGPKIQVAPTPDWETLGITDKVLQKKIRLAFAREFNNWGYDSRFLQDGTGHGHFGTLMWQSYRTATGPDGEVFLAVQLEEERARAYQHRWATFVTLLDGDRVDTPPEQVGQKNVRDGLMFDKWGRRIGFYYRRSHPNDGSVDASDLEFDLVRREMPNGRPVGIHWFSKVRSGQIRGLSELVTILRQSGMLGDFDDAYLGAAIINQTMATYIKTELSAQAVANNLAPATDLLGYDPMKVFGEKCTYYKGVDLRVGGHRLPVLPPGDEISMSAVNRAIGDPSSFRNGFLREFASALDVSFEQLSANFSDANYSAARAALLEVWRGVLKLREEFTSGVCSLIYRAVIEEAFKKGFFGSLLNGLPDFDTYAAAWTECNWVGPTMPQIDPEKDANAIKTMLGLHLESHTGALQAQGKDRDEVFEQIEDDRNEADARGFSLETKDEAQAEAAAMTAEAMDSQERQRKPKKGPGQRDGDGDGQIDEENQQ